LGWNNTDVLVSFTCTNATSCPVPIMVTQEGTGLVIGGTAFNSDHQANVNVTLSIDKTPPVLTLSAPNSGATFTALAADVAGSVADVGSGIGPVRCNGVDVVATSGQVTCTIPLRSGANAVVVQVSDLAGNSSSTGRHVLATTPPSSLTVSPSSRTLAIGQTAKLHGVDERGSDIAGLTWTSSDETVVTVDSEGTVIPVAAGHAAVTVAGNGLTATGDIVVVAGAALPLGTLAWATDTFPGGAVNVIRPRRVDASIPALLAVGVNDVRGLRDDGSSVGVEGPPTPAGAALSQVTPDAVR
jgi:uncharacterized protein YjdB